MRTYPFVRRGRRFAGVLAVCVLAAASVGVVTSSPAQATHPSNQTLDYGAIFVESSSGSSYRFDAVPVGGGTPIFGESLDPATGVQRSYDPGPNGRLAVAEWDITSWPTVYQHSVRIVTPPDTGFAGDELGIDPRVAPVPPAMVPPGYEPDDIYYASGIQWAGPNTIALEAFAQNPGGLPPSGIALMDISDPGNVTLTSIQWAAPVIWGRWRISADGSHYAFQDTSGGSGDIDIFDFATGQRTADDISMAMTPGNFEWSPSGDLLAVLENEGDVAVRVYDVNGILQAEVPGNFMAFSWAPDGAGIIVLPYPDDWSVAVDLDLVHYDFDGTSTTLTPGFWHYDPTTTSYLPFRIDWMERRGLLTETVTSPGGADIVLDLDGGGAIESAAALEPPAPPPPGVTFPYGLVDFTLVGVPEGGTAQVTIDFPAPLPVPFAYYKYQGGSYVDATSIATHDNGRVTLTLEDNGPFDADATPGRIVDPGGPVTVAPTASDSFDISLTGAHALAAGGPLDTGDFAIVRDGYGIRSVTGAGTVGSTTVTMNVNRFWNFGFWLGSVTVTDPGVGTVTTPLFGRVSAAGDDGARAAMRWFDFSGFPFRAYNLVWEVHDTAGGVGSE